MSTWQPAKCQLLKNGMSIFLLTMQRCLTLVSIKVYFNKGSTSSWIQYLPVESLLYGHPWNQNKSVCRPVLLNYLLTSNNLSTNNRKPAANGQTSTSHLVELPGVTSRLQKVHNQVHKPISLDCLQ